MYRPSVIWTGATGTALMAYFYRSHGQHRAVFRSAHFSPETLITPDPVPMTTTILITLIIIIIRSLCVWARYARVPSNYRFYWYRFPCFPYHPEHLRLMVDGRGASSPCASVSNTFISRTIVNGRVIHRATKSVTKIKLFLLYIFGQTPYEKIGYRTGTGGFRVGPIAALRSRCP